MVEPFKILNIQVFLNVRCYKYAKYRDIEAYTMP